MPCRCESSPLDPAYCHMLTGEPRIVGSNKLRKLITKGSKYRKPSTICRDRAKSSIVGGINGAVEQLSNKRGTNKLQFSQ